jgi:hypothetical protein
MERLRVVKDPSSSEDLVVDSVSSLDGLYRPGDLTPSRAVLALKRCG